MIRPLRVLHLMHDSRRSGVPAVAVGVIRAMRRWVDSTAFFAYDGIYAAELRGEGFRVHTVGARVPLIWRIYRFLMVFRLAAIARQHDVVHIHSIKMAFLVIAAKAMGAKVIFHLHELPRRIGPLLRNAIGAADVIVFCSSACERHYAAVPAREKRTILNAISFDELPSADAARSTGKIVMAASINRNKGQHFLLEAFSLLPEGSSELWLYGTVGLSGRGYMRGLKEFVRRNHLEERVFFPGPTADIHAVLREAEIVVHTSMNESFGMVVLEAIAAGVPVIAHDVGGIGEIVADGVTGYLIRPGDVKALVLRMESLLGDPDLRKRMGAAASERAREHFDIRGRIPLYQCLYREVANG
jgi:glycosyltransferase involved in cell wall biosynthesis